jgi:flagellar basal-body rod protein FlgC
LQTVRVASIAPDRSPGQQVHNPQHPDAGPDGLVMMPNVNIAFEMVDLITASRAYEANLSVVKNAREMAMKALQIGK